MLEKHQYLVPYGMRKRWSRSGFFFFANEMQVLQTVAASQVCSKLCVCKGGLELVGFTKLTSRVWLLLLQHWPFKRSRTSSGACHVVMKALCLSFPFASSPSLFKRVFWAEKFVHVVTWAEQPCPCIRVVELEGCELQEGCWCTLIAMPAVANVRVPPVAFLLWVGGGQRGP